jgi:hypothetical protein
MLRTAAQYAGTRRGTRIQEVIEPSDLPDFRRVLEEIVAAGRARETPASPARRGRPSRKLTDEQRAAIIWSLARKRPRRAIAKDMGIARATLDRFIAREIPSHAYAYGLNFRELHGEYLATRGVSPEVAAARQYRSRPDSLFIPLWTVDGHRAWSQKRVDEPERRSKRFVNGRHAREMVDVSPAARTRVLDHNRTLYVTEGPVKADAATSHSLACVAFVGIRLLCCDDETWDHIGVKDREVRIVFDGDADTNREVAAAEKSTAEYLTSRVAHVKKLRLPSGMGLDDYLAGRGRVQDLPLAGGP